METKEMNLKVMTKTFSYDFICEAGKCQLDIDVIGPNNSSMVVIESTAKLSDLGSFALGSVLRELVQTRVKNVEKIERDEKNPLDLSMTFSPCKIKRDNREDCYTLVKEDYLMGVMELMTNLVSAGLKYIRALD